MGTIDDMQSCCGSRCNSRPTSRAGAGVGDGKPGLCSTVTGKRDNADRKQPRCARSL